MLVKDIYEKYMTPHALKDHLLWTGALMQVLLENWQGPAIDKKALVMCCLFHDIAKPINFDLTKQAQYGMLDEDVKKLQYLQKDITAKYGTIEHHAAVEICKEIGLSEKAVELVDHLEWEYIPKWLTAGDIESLLPIYCDMRISPRGVLPLETRINELYDRIGGKNFISDLKNGKKLEMEVNKHIRMDLQLITTQQLSSYFVPLLNSKIS